MTNTKKSTKTKKSTLQGAAAELKAAKAEIAKERATIRRQKAEIKAWGISQRKAMNELIRTGQVPSDVNSKDNNQNRNANVGKKGNVPLGPKKPTDAEKKVQEIRTKVKKYKGRGGGGAPMLSIKQIDAKAARLDKLS